MTFISCLLLILSGCSETKSGQPSKWLNSKGYEISPSASYTKLQRPPQVDERVELLGYSLPDEITEKAPAELELWWRVLEGGSFEDHKVFVHGLLPGGEIPTAQADHPFWLGQTALHEGDTVQTHGVLKIPAGTQTDRLIVRVGLYRGKERFEVDGAHDGKNRIELKALKLPGGKPSHPTAKLLRRRDDIVIDGILSEASWSKAERLGPFESYRGRGRVRAKTYARMTWDADFLYLAFECDDADIHTPYTRRDDPLYESEAVEIFIDADGDKDQYVELQAAPNDVHFDAAFKGGRRKNFDTSYDVDYTTKTVIEGTLNKTGDVDRRWVSEWKIPVAELRDAPSKIQKGMRWQINLFRLDRRRKGTKVVGNEATAWSSPLSGDFHNLDRFGTIVFQ